MDEGGFANKNACEQQCVSMAACNQWRCVSDKETSPICFIGLVICSSMASCTSPGVVTTGGCATVPFGEKTCFDLASEWKGNATLIYSRGSETKGLACLSFSNAPMIAQLKLLPRDRTCCSNASASNSPSCKTQDFVQDNTWCRIMTLAGDDHGACESCVSHRFFKESNQKKVVTKHVNLPCNRPRILWKRIKNCAKGSKWLFLSFWL